MTVSAPTLDRRRRRAAGEGRGSSAQLADAERRWFRSRTGGRRRLHLRDEAERRADCGRRPSRRPSRPSSAASTRSASPSPSSPHTATATRSWCNCPASTTPTRVKRLIGSTALLELKIVEDGPAPVAGSAAASTQRRRPPTWRWSPAADARRAPATLLLPRAPRRAGHRPRPPQRAPTLDENNLPAIGFSINREGAVKFGQLTGENIGKPLAIILDNRVETVAAIDQAASPTKAQIFGSFTAQEVADMSLMLRSGALPASLTYLEERTVGPTLGADSIRAGITRRSAACVLVALFMLGYYKLAGHQRDRLDRAEPDHPAGLHGLHRRGHDAARHRRLHPDDRHGRRLERADLRAHQGRARARQGRRAAVAAGFDRVF